MEIESDGVEKSRDRVDGVEMEIESDGVENGHLGDDLSRFLVLLLVLSILHGTLEIPRRLADGVEDNINSRGFFIRKPFVTQRLSSILERVS